jgi:hypothetical protein
MGAVGPNLLQTQTHAKVRRGALADQRPQADLKICK